MTARFLNFTAAFVIGFVVGILLLVGLFTNLAQFAGIELPHGENLKFRPSGPNSTVNEGSFEIPANFNDTSDEHIDRGCKKICGGSTTLAPWQISRQGAPVQDCANADDAVAWCRDDQTFGAARPKEGHFFVDLTGIAPKKSDTFGSIKQNVEDTTPGAPYELAFYVGTSSETDPQPQPGGIDGFYELAVTINGMEPRRTKYSKTTEKNHWDQQTIQFTAQQGGTTIEFSASGTGGNYLGIDVVSVRRTDCIRLIQLISGCR